MTFKSTIFFILVLWHTAMQFWHIYLNESSLCTYSCLFVSPYCPLKHINMYFGVIRIKLIWLDLNVILITDWLYFACQIISAQQLPKINTEKASSIVDPQVWVEIHGVSIDNTRSKTHRIDNNGKWSSFTIKHHQYIFNLVLLTVWIF